MQKKLVVDAVDRCSQVFTKNNRLFDGILVVLEGNWAEILPVVPRGSWGSIVNSSL
jgi:hypothetical protein